MTRIDPPEWATQPDLGVDEVTVAEFAAIRRHRDKMFEVVHREIETYLGNPKLVFDGDEEDFPHRSRLTGAYYIARESYSAHRDPAWFQISVMCHCLEPPKAGVDRDDDYLGLEVWLKCVPGRWSSFRIYRNTDSSSI
ncbi:MAG: hypothetical protein P4L84_06870 [Isosphaeraceae bacterium]|nr:hypothetical protein [Isosphaeraceae bacterium]